MRYINDGWLLRYTHSNGASVFFLFIYLHLFKNINRYAVSGFTKLIGGLIYLVVMAVAFMGYLLPWGQMSF